MPPKSKANLSVVKPHGEATKPMGRKVAPSKTRKDGSSTINLPKDGKPGNTKIDQAFFERHADSLRPAPEDAELPFGVGYIWDGHDAAEIGGKYSDEFALPDDERACTGRALVRGPDGRKVVDKAGILLTRPCAKPPMAGSVVCTAHGGLTPGGIKVAQQRLAASADRLAGRLIQIALDPTTLDTDAIRAINSCLDRIGIRAGVDIGIEVPEWQQMLKDMFNEAESRG